MEGITFYFDWEIRLILLLQSHLNTFTLLLAEAASVLGQEAFGIFVLGFLYWSYDKELAKKIGTAILITACLNPLIKNVFLRRRPYFDTREIKCLLPLDENADLYDVAAQGYSFPSGHSMNSAALFGSLRLYFNSPLFSALAILLPLVVGLSRIVLGVHYPTDVLAGLLIGYLIALIANAMQKKFTRNQVRLFLILAVLPGLFYCRTKDYFTALGALLGGFGGVWFEEKAVHFQNTKDPLRAALRVLGGFVIFYGGNVLLKRPFSEAFLQAETMPSFLVRTLRYTILLFLLLGVYPLVFAYLNKKEINK